MQGHRLKAGPDGYLPEPMQPGDYFKDTAGNWCGMTPNGYRCGLRNHAVTEHEDGTITVSPSIRVSTDNDTEVWHGFLERGVWREC
jgi:hypothetical protein